MAVEAHEGLGQVRLETPLGDLPRWDLTDLYSGPGSRRLESDLAAATTRAQAFRKAHQGRLQDHDGKTLAAWRCVDMSYWSVRDGAITGESTADHPCTKNKFVVWQGGELSDFELKVKFRVKGNGCNSGVQFRSVFRPDGLAIGYQADIYQSGGYLGGVCDELHKRAGPELLSANGSKSVIDKDGKRTATKLGEQVKMNPWPEWNDYHIIAEGTHITLKINGQTASELIDNEEQSPLLTNSRDNDKLISPFVISTNQSQNSKEKNQRNEKEE